MATEVLMPKLGLTMEEGTIEEWKKKEGDAVKKGDILFSVATDNRGIPELRQAIAGKLTPVRGMPEEPDNLHNDPGPDRQDNLQLPLLRLLPPLLPPWPAAPSPSSAAAPAAMWLPSGLPSWAPRSR